MRFLKALTGCKKMFADTRGQSTVEFAIVTAALLVIAITLGVFLNMTDTGMLVQHALSSASHNLSGAMLGIVGDVFSV